MNFDETQALDSSNYDDSDEEPGFERNRKLVGHLKVFKQLDLEEKVYKIYEGENFIGRDEESDVYIPRKSLSKSHACIEVSDNLHLIYDNSSKNKTRRDKVALRPQVRYEVKSGDVITVADLKLQYFIGDVPQDDDDNDDTGSETGSESMLPIDATTTDVANDNKEDISKVYAADTDSDTDDEKPIKKHTSGEPKTQASNDDSHQEYKPQVPNVMYDSYDEDEEIIAKKPPGVILHKDEEALDVSAGGTLAFGLVSPTEERPFIRPTPKQAVKETPATLLYPSDTQDTAASLPKDGVPSTLLYASQTPDGLTKHSSPISPNKKIEDTPATLLYGTQTQDKAFVSPEKHPVNTPATLLYGTQTQDKAFVSPEKHPVNTPATLLYGTETQDKSFNSATSEGSPEKALIVNTPATLLYNTDKQDTIDSHSKSHESSSSEIFEPETQGFSPKETSFCLPTQPYIKETPAEEKGEQISNIPESGDEEEVDGIKKVLSFDESATQAYTWNDSDATDDDDDDLRFQPTQAYPTNVNKPENKQDSTDDEHSNPDLYATTTPAEDAVADSGDEERVELKGPSVQPTMPYGIDDMETQAYEVDDKDVSIKSSDSKTDKQQMHDYSEKAAQAYDREQDDSNAHPDKINKGPEGHTKGHTSKVHFKTDLQPTLPYSMQETQAYEANDDSSEETTDNEGFEKPSFTGSKATQSVDNMMETQAYDACEEAASNVESTVPYSMMETQAYDADEETTGGEKMFKKPIVKGREATHVVEQTLPYSLMETQAYDADEETTDGEKTFKKPIVKGREATHVVEQTLPYSLMETQAYDAEEDDSSAKNRHETSTETANLPEPTLPYDVTDDVEREKEEDVVIPDTQAYGVGDESETVDETAGPSGINESATVQVERSESEAFQDIYEATQAFGLGSHMNEVIPDSEDISPQEIPPPEAIKSKNDKNNNTTNNVSDNQEKPQEMCELIIRPVRRGRGRVTQGENDHPMVSKAVNVLPKSSRGRRSRKSTKEENAKENDLKTAKSRRSARNKDKSVDNDKMATSVPEAPESRRSARNEDKSVDNEGMADSVTKAPKSRKSVDNEEMADSVTKAPKSRRSARNVDKSVDNEEMADTVPEASKSRRNEEKSVDNEETTVILPKARKSRQSARNEDKIVDNEDESVSVPEAPRSRRSARNEDKSVDNEEMATSVTKASKSRRSARNVDKSVDNEDVSDSVPKAPRSRRSARNEDKNVDNEEVSVSVPEAPRSRRSARNEDKSVDNEEMAASVTKASKSRRSARNEDKTDNNDKSAESDLTEAPLSSQGTRRTSTKTRKTDEKKSKDSPKPEEEGTLNPEEEKTHKSEKEKEQEEYAESLEMKDSEEEFRFKKGKGKKKGKQPAKKHLEVVEDDPFEIDSEDLPPLDAILSEKKQGKDKTKKEEQEQKVSSSPGSTARGKRGKTKTEDETPAKKIKKENHDDSMKQRSSLREHKQPMPRVMFTGVIDKDAEKIVTTLGGTIESNIYNCTHLITDKVRRTVKFLCGLAMGCIIVQPAWLKASKKSKNFIDHEQFFVQDQATEKTYSFSLQLSHEQALKKGLLEGYKVHVTKNVKPEPQQMKDIIQCAKGEFLARMPRAKDDNVLIISCDADKDTCKQAVEIGIPVYSAELLLTGILRQHLSLDENLLFVEGARKRRNEGSVDESSQSRSSKRKKK